MMRYMGLVASLLFSRTLASDVMVALFDLTESHVSGNVTVADGLIKINLDISELIDGGYLPSGCVINETVGILYHVHSSWGHTPEQSSFVSGCGATFTGGHFDPYAACAAASGNTACSGLGGCISSGSYSCSSSNYASDAYKCEVGDWSGKYGKFSYLGNGKVHAEVQSFGEVTGDQLVGKSIVFHCPTGSKARAFCASFQSTSSAIAGSSTQQTNRYKLKAEFNSALDLSHDKNAYVALNYNGQVEVKFSQSALSQIACPGDTLRAWIGEWNIDQDYQMSFSACTEEMIGVPHDPTNQCYAATTDSSYCTNGKLCSDANYTYACDYNSNPFSCSPMDLSGRYGSINLMDSQNGDISISTFDRYMADLTNLIHRSVVLSCPTNGQAVLCAKLQSVAIGTATASFSNADVGAQGIVNVTDGLVSINVSFANAQQNFLGVDLPLTCFDSGLKAHIHEKWAYGDSKARRGAKACNKTFTGGHWDPWAGCSTTTGYTSVCSIPPSPSPTSCVAVGGSAGNGKYICNATSYKTNPFLCEVGDWSSKYGTYEFTGNYLIQREDHSPLEVDASDLVGRSIVFHCANDASRAFCAPFLLENDVADGVDAKPTWPLSTETGNQMSYAKASLKDSESSIMLHSNGHYHIDLDVSYDVNCSSTIGYAVFNDESCNSIYDPTVQCMPISEHDGVLCFTQETCGVTPYSCDPTNDPYSCSPSDLSGKYGITNSEKMRMTSGWDELMIPLAHLKTRYLGLYCTDTWGLIECHPWEVADYTTTSTTETPSSTSTTESAGHQQTYSVGLGLALLVVMSFLY